MTVWRAVAARFGIGRTPCEVHRSTLLELLDGWPRDEALVGQALDHLDRCAPCRREMGEYALILSGLRRLGAAARRTERAPGGWARVLARIQAPRSRGFRPRRASIAGLVAVPLVAAMVVVSGLSSRETGVDVAGGTAGPAGGAAAQVATPPAAVAAAALHAAALQRAFRISDAAMATVAPDAAEAEAVPYQEPGGVPRGPLPDGMAILAGREVPTDAATWSAGPPVAPAIVPE